MIVAQLSDLHLVAPGQKLFGLMDTAATAKTAIESINRLDPPPDVIFVTGDLVASPDESAYELARKLLDELVAPYYVLPGNHDRRGMLLKAFAGHSSGNDAGFVQYTVEDHSVRFVVLDTLLEGHDEGQLSEAQLKWLDRKLTDDPSRPTIVVMHHPPFETGIWWMDSCGLSGTPGLKEVLSDHPQVRQILCGHVHRPISATWNGIAVTIAPATSFEVGFDLAIDSTPKVGLTKPGYRIYDLRGETWVTHTIHPVPADQQFDLSEFIQDWPATEDAWRKRKERLELSRL